MKLAYLDYEFCDTTEYNVTPVCCSVRTFVDGVEQEFLDFWLYRDSTATKLHADYLKSLQEQGYIFCSFAFEAEARAMLACGVDPLKNKIIDLYLEYRQLANHNKEIQFGKHLVGGKVRFLTPKPRYQEEYCREDVEHLRELHTKMFDYWYKYLRDREDNVSKKKLIEEQFVRGEYAARTALMTQAGYPVDVEGIRYLSKNTAILLRALQRDVNEALKDVLPFKLFEWDAKIQDFKQNTKAIKDYIVEHYGDKWPEYTKTGPSIGLEVLEKATSSRHQYKATLVDQLLRVAKFKNSMSGFVPTRNKVNSFFDYLGSDRMVRPYFGIYGAQSSRSQPKATGYLFLKSAVFRGLMHPPPGKMVVGIDYASQEFLIAAMLSGDKKMIEAYASGDVYLAFAKQTKAVPPEGTKKSHGEVRDRFKSAVLGIIFLMAAPSLSRKITDDTGRYCSEEESQKYIDLFYSTYSTFEKYQQNLIQDYRAARGYMTVRLVDGWRLLGDNPNHRSVANCPIQGTGAVVMRRAVALAQDAGLTVIQTLHDAIYIMCDVGDWEAADTLSRCMERAFTDTLGAAYQCRQDMQAWGDGLTDGTVITPKGMECKTQSRYLDKRAAAEYAKWEPYLRPDNLNL